jgi:UrcA family protein
MFRIAVTLALLSGLSAAPVAFGQDQGTTKVNITFPNRQLQDPAQAKAVYARLYKAVQYACQTEGGEGPSWRVAADRACEDSAMRGALQQLNRPELMALYTPGAPQMAFAEEARRKH